VVLGGEWRADTTKQPKHIPSVEHKRGTVAKQSVAPGRTGIGGSSRQDPNLAPKSARKLGGAEGPGALPGLDDNDKVGKPCNEAIARQEAPGLR